MELEEIAQILASCAPDRLLYETALLSGLRKNELRSLTIAHLDLERGGLRLDAAWTKNRKAGFQPLPQNLATRLQTFADSGEPARLYQQNFRRNVKADPARIPTDPLLYVPSNPARSLDQDLKRCGIPKTTPKGKLDFHAARVACVNLLLEDQQISLKDAQGLARHSVAKLTLDVYGRAKDDRMQQAIERMAQRIVPVAVSAQNHAIYMQRQAVGAEPEIATRVSSEGCDPMKMAPRVSFGLWFDAGEHGVEEDIDTGIDYRLVAECGVDKTVHANLELPVRAVVVGKLR
jgi:hypothetical protein